MAPNTQGSWLHESSLIRGGRRVVNRDAACFGNQHNKQCRKCQHLRWRQKLPALTHGDFGHFAKVCGTRRQGYRENREHHRRLGDRGKRHFATAAEPAERAACVKPAKRKEKTSER